MSYNLSDLRKVAEAGRYLECRRPYHKACKLFHAMQVKRILDRRSLYEGRYRYRDVEADGQHLAIINKLLT